MSEAVASDWNLILIGRARIWDCWPIRKVRNILPDKLIAGLINLSISLTVARSFSSVKVFSSALLSERMKKEIFFLYVLCAVRFPWYKTQCLQRDGERRHIYDQLKAIFSFTLFSRLVTRSSISETFEETSSILTAELSKAQHHSLKNIYNIIIPVIFVHWGATSRAAATFKFAIGKGFNFSSTYYMITSRTPSTFNTSHIWEDRLPAFSIWTNDVCVKKVVIVTASWRIRHHESKLCLPGRSADRQCLLKM